ncbi:type II toxin-antitoxin system VapC family toxin [Candidatus Daviesbacteria bacterium]|nr:type II toxin-antitoxin system VapC family toxin [Candidatus Daviesbacteria bacterium]
MYKVFIDTSAWMAYYLSDEPDHIRIKNLIKRFIKERTVIVTSNDIIDETVTNFIYLNPKVANKFIEFVIKSIETKWLTQLWVDEEIQIEAFEIVQKFSGHKLSMSDATTVVLMKKYNLESIISLDSDFKKVGISTLP